MKTNLENKWIAITWWIILLIVLPFDQEKIVVVCFVVFLYALFLFMRDDIGQFFMDKESFVSRILLETLDLKISLLRSWVVSLNTLRAYKQLFKGLLNKLYLTLSVYISRQNLSFISDAGETPLTAFNAVNRSFYFIKQESEALANVHSNLVVTKLLLSSFVAEFECDGTGDDIT